MMTKRISWPTVLVTLAAVWLVTHAPSWETVVRATASFPTAVKSFTTKNASDTIQASHMNDVQDEIAAIESDLFNGMSRVRLGSSTVTLVSDAFTATKSLHAVDTEAAAASDDLSTISAGSGVAAGHLLTLYAANAARVVTVKDSVGNITLAGSDYAMNSAKKSILLRYDGTNWVEVARAQASPRDSNLLFVDATYDIGASGATRPRDVYLSRNLVIGGTTTHTGNLVSDLLFTDATYDIGKSGATRPRDLFTSRDVTVGRTLTVTGGQDKTHALTGLIQLNGSSAAAAQGLTIDTTSMANASNAIFVNMPSGFTGNIISANLNGAQKFFVTQVGDTTINSTTAAPLTITSNAASGVVQLSGASIATFQLASDSSTQVTLKNVSNGPMLFGTNNATRMTLGASGGLVIGAPTGGNKGDGTLNATAVYDDNVLLTDWVFDLLHDGRTDHPMPAGGRLYTLDETRRSTEADRRLPWMPTRAAFEQDRHLGGMISRLWFGQEQQQIYIQELHATIAALEARLAALERRTR